MPGFKINTDFVPVPKDYIEHIMPTANAAYVKVYLYAMLLAAEGRHMKNSEIAKKLGLIESDVVAALSYWNGQGVMSGTGDTIIIKRSSDEELTALAGLARERDLQVRFIEIMPLGEGKRFGLRTEDELISMLSKTYGEPAEASFVSGNGPARYISFEGFRGNVGFISAISHKFCSSCNRLRLTADGHIKTCLQFENGCFLREILRDGTDDETIMKTIEKAVYEKPRCHEFLLERDDADARLMSQIGG